MEFFSAEVIFDEVYFDTKMRMQTVCRGVNDDFVKENNVGLHTLVTKVTMKSLTLIVMSENNQITSEEVKKDIQKTIKIIAEKSSYDISQDDVHSIDVNLITLNNFVEIFKDNAYATLINNQNVIMEKMHINFDNKVFPEKLLDVTNLFEDTSSKKSIFPKDEMKRIKSNKNKNGFDIAPIHYIIAEDEHKIREQMRWELVQHLYESKRITNRRYIELGDSDKLLTYSNIQNLNNLDAGHVVIEVKNLENWVEFLYSLHLVYDLSNLYCHNYTIIILAKGKCDEIFTYLSKTCELWPFVVLKNEQLNKMDAIKYFKELLKNQGIKGYAHMAKQLLEKEKEYSYYEVNNIFNRWYRNQYNIQVNFPEYVEIIDQYYADAADMIDGWEELNALIGLKNIKTLVKKIVDYHSLEFIRTKANPKIKRPTMHMVFTGNPGTAKTTVARILAKILKQQGILEKGELFEVGRSDLVGRYVGWTAKNVKEYFEKAKGSVLFIDEAYALADEQKSFGDEAINAIVQEMENHRDDVLVIFAGYKKEMRRFVNTNSGLVSRISYFVDFPDYSERELFEILVKMSNEESLLLDDGVEEQFYKILKMMRTDLGNGRIVRNIYNQAKLNQADRIVKLDPKEQETEIVHLRLEDFEYDIV